MASIKDRPSLHVSFCYRISNCMFRPIYSCGTLRAGRNMPSSRYTRSRLNDSCFLRLQNILCHWEVATTEGTVHLNSYIYIYIIQILSVCVSVCLSSIGGQTAGPIMAKFGTHMRIDLGMVPTKNWPHEWPGSVGSLGPISESGLSCQLLLRAVVWQMTSQ